MKQGLLYIHKMKKAQLMAQPILYIFYALVAAMVLFFGIRVIIGLNDNGSKVELESFIIDLKDEIDTVYHDSYGSSKSLDKITVPKDVIEICFVGSKQLDRVHDSKLKQLINLDNEHNVFFGGVDMDDNPARSFNFLEIDGTICDRTIDRKINLILENNGNYVLLKEAS